MSNDLLFSVLPREGTVKPVQDEQRVEQVSKQAAIRELNDEEKTLTAEEREQREKQKQKKQAERASKKKKTDDDDDVDPRPGHLDVFV